MRPWSRVSTGRAWPGKGLAAEGAGAPPPQTVTFAHFRAAAAAAGFTAPSDDETLLAAVRLRFRPWARGPLTADDFRPLA